MTTTTMLMMNLTPSVRQRHRHGPSPSDRGVMEAATEQVPVEATLATENQVRKTWTS
jgi:hypothetical protein